MPDDSATGTAASGPSNGDSGTTHSGHRDRRVVTFTYDHIDQVRAELNAVSK